MILIALLIIVIWCYILYIVDKKIRNRPKRAIDHYQTAARYDYVQNKPAKAKYHYKRALELAQVEIEDAPFIRERIADRMRPNQDYQFALDLQRIFDQTALVQFIPKPEPVWHTDTQNVHDTLLSDTVVQQFFKLQKMGMDTAPMSMPDIIREIQDSDAVNMLWYIDKHDSHITKMNVGEIAVVQEVWKQVQKNPMAKESFCFALRDSWNGGTPYCVTGRTSRIIQSLAYMVPDAPDMGILLTKEAVRNEIFQSAGKILDRHLEQSGIREVYNKLEPTVEEQLQIDTIQENVKTDIAKMVDGYNLDRDICEKIKEECLSAL